VIDSIYELIGRLVVRIAWMRYGRQIKLAAAAALGLGAVVGFVLARRQPPEG
jgi:hypothetical protein